MGELKQDGGEARGSARVARTALESAISNIWTEILGEDSFGVNDDFFELGGDSLGAVRMLAALEELLLVQVSFTEFLDGPTVAALATTVQCAREHPVQPVASLPASPSSDRAPCSFAQERLWFLEQLGGSGHAYNMPTAARIRGPLDAHALERSLREVVRRHAALRTTFGTEESSVVQVTEPEPSIELEVADLRGHADPEAEAAGRVGELASALLDLERGPLMRALLLRLSDAEYILELVFHHMVCDGFSHVVVWRELGALYDAFVSGRVPSLAPPRAQYPDYARAERRTLAGQALEDAVAPWVGRLSGAASGLELPSDRPRPAAPSYRGATHRMRLSDETTTELRSFARAVKATPFATLLAVYYVLLYRHTGQDEIVVGATTSGRDRPELEDGVGLFASTVALSGDLSGEPSFRELVGRVREVVLWAVAHERAPFEQIVARLGLEPDLSRHPLFGAFCAHVPLIELPFVGAEPYHARPSTSRFDLTLFIEEEAGDALELAWEYSTDLFDSATIEQLARRYVLLLDAALRDPDRRIDELPMLADAEQRAAVDGGTRPDAEYPVACMHERFEEQAAARPDAIAVSTEGGSVSYAELNARANRLAHRLRALGARPETLVALFLEPSVALVTAILGVLKAGAAYLPLDPEHPGDRLEFVLGDAGASLLVTEEELLERLPQHDLTVVCLGRDDAVLAQQPDVNPQPLADPASLAYVIYTSGSTGRPKGVQIEHRQIARLFSATDAWFRFGPSDTWMLLHSYAFDFSVWELWGALAHGGRLVVSPVWTTRSPPALAALVASERVTVLNATPSLFVAVQDELLRAAGELALRLVVFGGEALAPVSLRPWFEHHGDDGPKLVNMYGITETTVHVTYRPLTAADCDHERSPIGVPIPDLSLYLLDPKGVPVPAGVAGELYVGGAGVARGYLNRPELTAERFLQNPFGPGRLYRTGDVARRLPDGEIDFRGRIDDQVKIRGFRIELGEIEAAIRELRGVAEVAVVAVSAAPGDTRLAAYVVPDGGDCGPAAERVREELRPHLERKLPGYMVPASLTLLERLPLTRNGKVDRRSLPAPSWDRQRADRFRVPQTPTELLIAEIWQAVLGVERVSLEDNFFNLGGHSLLAARVVTQVRERCEIELSVRALFAQPTLADFATEVDTARGNRSSPTAGDDAQLAEPAAGDRDGYPLSFPQQQLLFFDQLTPGSVTYNAALAVRIVGELDRGALRHALTEVFKRQQALRTVLVWEDSTPKQLVLDDWSAELPLIDLCELPQGEREAELERLLRERALQPFDLSRDVMLRSALFRLGPSEHVLLFAPHHVAFDAWAVEVLYREVEECYRAAREHRAPRLPELSLQYGDFALWQRDRLRGELLEGELAFWRTHLAGAPTVIRLPTDRPRPQLQTFEGASQTVRLDSGLADALRSRCSAAQVTPYVLLLATFATLLYRRSGQDDILFGGPMANRDRPGLEHLIGFFANTIVVRTRLGGNPRFLDLLAGVRESVLASYEHQEVPLELVVDAVRPERDPAVNPLFQVNFRVRVGAPPTLKLAGTTTTPVPVDLGLARFELALELHLLEDGIEAEWSYNTALFDRSTVHALAGDFTSLLRQILAAPETRLLSFELSREPVAVNGAERSRSRVGGVRRAHDSQSAR